MSCLKRHLHTMSERFDTIILGATGYTGKHTVKYFATLIKEAEYSTITWGIAGRSNEKLKKLTSELEQNGVKVQNIIICDVNDEKSLLEVARKARVIINCTGPNTLLSGPIVKSCIASGTHYVDISAELYHMMNIYETYNKPAEQANVLIIPACGFASLPVSAGLIHLENNFKGVLRTVECYTTVDFPRSCLPGRNNCLVHYGTWESLVHELQNLKQFHDEKSHVYPGFKPAPQNLKRSFFHRNHGRLWFPYPGPDESIVAIDQAYRSQKGTPTYFFKSYVTPPLLIHLIAIPAFFIYYYLCYFKCFRKLLWKHPKLFSLGYFSHEGPSEQVRKDTKYSFTLYAKGTDNNNVDKSLTAKVSGDDPGYRTTAISAICAALTILKERPKMPTGGVINSGTAFLNTRIVDRLNNSGMKIEIVNNINDETRIVLNEK